ncbi:MAG: Obg family GTPase CgtA [Vicinamibacteria bacterium]|nr:Obg family GTPase CgtA [Vicinamibacteria bacterium]
MSFRREAYVPRGGPDGGNGGHGGDVVMVAVSHQNTLLPLRYHSEFRAERGRHGGGSNCTGADAVETLVAVPPGTIATDEATGAVLGEVMAVGDRVVLARGGRGGRGNRSFLSNRNRAPRESGPGEPGEERYVQLDLKLLADVGLLGLPNAGKSTLLSRISAARPRIGDYPFTTLSPVLGMVSVGERDFVVADIPGIIEGAHEGAGLGLRFLRHVERTRALAFVIDASGARGDDPVGALATLREELAHSHPELLSRPALVVAAQRDACVEPDPLPALELAADLLGLRVFPISAVSGQGLETLLHAMADLVAAAALRADVPGA